MSTLRLLSLLGLVVGGSVPPAMGQDRWGPSCRKDEDSSWGERFCTVEARTLRPGGTIRVNAHPNGGVTLVGWDRAEIGLRARVQTRARDSERAEDLARAVRLNVTGTEISVDGPRTRDRESW